MYDSCIYFLKVQLFFCVVCEAVHCNRIPRRCIIISYCDSHHSTFSHSQNCNNIYRDIKFQFRDSEMKHDYCCYLRARFGSQQSGYLQKSGQQIQQNFAKKNPGRYKRSNKQNNFDPTTGKMHLFTEPFENSSINLRSDTPQCNNPFTLLRKTAPLHAWQRQLAAAYNSHFYLRPTFWRRHSHA